MPGVDNTVSSPAEVCHNFMKDDTDKTECRPNASQPLPIIRTSTHKLATHDKEDDDYDADDDDDADQGLFNSSPPLLFTVSSFSEWGTESASTDDGAESDPFCYDDEVSRARIQSKPLPVKEVKKDTTSTITSSPSPTEGIENPPLKTVACVQEAFVGYENGRELAVAKSKSMLKRWAEAFWGAVTKIFSRRHKGRVTEGKGRKQS